MSDTGDIFKASLANYLRPVAAYLDDESVTEVMINGHNDIWIETKGKVQKTTAAFPDEDSLRAAVNNIAQSVGRRIDDENPRLDARLPNGFRIHAVLPPMSRQGTTVAIRKFSTKQFTFRDFVQMGVLTPDAAQFLDICIKLGKNTLVSGGTGSGKTTLLSLLANRIPKGERIMVIEDSSELKVEYDHVIFFETRMPDAQGKKEVNIRDLLKSGLRLRPDRIIVGEVRSGEALELIQAMNTGHKGCMGTVHANSAEDALVRLEALSQSGDAKLSEKALRHQISSAIEIVVQVSRYSDGKRRVATIAEVQGFDEKGNYNVVPIFELGSVRKQADGSLLGKMHATGILPSFMEEIEDAKIPFGRDKFENKEAA